MFIYKDFIFLNSNHYLFQFQLINIGSQYNYGNDNHAEFLCVVSREYGPTQLTSKEQEATDRVKVPQLPRSNFAHTNSSQNHPTSRD